MTPLGLGMARFSPLFGPLGLNTYDYLTLEGSALYKTALSASIRDYFRQEKLFVGFVKKARKRNFDEGRARPETNYGTCMRSKR